MATTAFKEPRPDLRRAARRRLPPRRSTWSAPTCPRSRPTAWRAAASCSTSSPASTPASARTASVEFNELAAGLDNTSVVCASADLPFALAHFCGAEGIENVTAASGFRSDFGDAFGVTMTEGPLRGLYARSVVVLDENGSVTYTELVPEIGQEPDYDAALAALK